MEASCWARKDKWEEILDLDSSPYDDTHKEIGNDTSDSHHEALDHGHTRVKAQHEEYVVWHSWV